MPMSMTQFLTYKDKMLNSGPATFIDLMLMKLTN